MISMPALFFKITKAAHRSKGDQILYEIGGEVDFRFFGFPLKREPLRFHDYR
jgi:hypothetical protein